MFGGVGTIAGTILGAIFLSIIQNGMLMLHINPFWQNVVIGVVMILALGIEQYRRNKMWQY
ncbi:unnamed protein product [marine sediment metagenome]|uniref:Uncharacterized protein n=1 Tax=marine sediment metagenome TaxID=412755 RepID=X1A0Q3_9ZZZZ